jgi:surfactin synthase thioesterase subunit
MINGSQDLMAPIEVVRSQAALLKRQVPTMELKELPADHFFILSHREECFQMIRQFFQSK